MIDLDFLESLIRAIDESSIDNVEIEHDGTRVRLSKSQLPQPLLHGIPGGTPAEIGGLPGVEVEDAGASASGPSEGMAPAGGGEGVASPPTMDINSPMVGTFYRAPAPDAPSYVDVGQEVSVGDTLCIIEAMKLMNELECEIPGTITEVCVENGDPVEFGQVLFRVAP